jgi:hypothetical protein
MKKTLLLAFFAAAVLAGTLTSLARPHHGFEADLAQLDAVVSCPLKGEILKNVPTDVVAVCAKYGDVAFRIAQRYPDKAPRLFALYGDLPQWKEVLDRYGHEVVPLVWYFEQGSKEIQVRQALGRAVEGLVHGERPAFKIESMTPEQFGYVAILMLEDRGYDLLGQFEFKDGEARRRPVERALSTIKELFFGGVSQLERVLVRGERWPTFGEIGSAALDVAVVAGGMSAIARLRIAGEAAEDARAATRFGRLSALEVSTGAIGDSVMTVGRKVVPAAAVLGVAYLAVNHPHIVTGAGQWIAERVGVAPWVGAFGIWLVLLIPIMLVIAPLASATRLSIMGLGLTYGACKNLALQLRRSVVWVKSAISKDASVVQYGMDEPSPQFSGIAKQAVDGSGRLDMNQRK